MTAVNGPAAGAGMSLALMGDLVLCARSAYFLQAFRRIGLVPDCGSTWLLPRLIGRARAMELSLLGERLPAETALAWGLVNRVFDDAALMGEARRLAHDLAAGPTVALGLIRRLYWESSENSHEEQLDARGPVCNALQAPRKTPKRACRPSWRSGRQNSPACDLLWCGRRDSNPHGVSPEGPQIEAA